MGVERSELRRDFFFFFTVLLECASLLDTENGRDGSLAFDVNVCARRPVDDRAIHDCSAGAAAVEVDGMDRSDGRACHDPGHVVEGWASAVDISALFAAVDLWARPVDWYQNALGLGGVCQSTSTMSSRPSLSSPTAVLGACSPPCSVTTLLPLYTSQPKPVTSCKSFARVHKNSTGRGGGVDEMFCVEGEGGGVFFSETRAHTQ